MAPREACVRTLSGFTRPQKPIRRAEPRCERGPSKGEDFGREMAKS